MIKRESLIQIAEPQRKVLESGKTWIDIWDDLTWKVVEPKIISAKKESG